MVCVCVCIWCLSKCLFGGEMENMRKGKKTEKRSS